MCIDGLFFTTCLSSPDDSVSGMDSASTAVGSADTAAHARELRHPANRQNMQVRFNIVRNIRKVTLIICRNQNSLDVAPMCGEQFFF